MGKKPISFTIEEYKAETFKNLTSEKFINRSILVENLIEHWIYEQISGSKSLVSQSMSFAQSNNQ